MAKLAGVSQPQTVYRWMGEGGVDAPQPTRVPIQNLAWAIESRYPDVARDLVRAAGHPWEDAPENDEPAPVPLSEALKEAIRREQGDEIASALIAHHEHLISGRTPPAEGDDPPWESGGRDRRTAG